MFDIVKSTVGRSVLPVVCGLLIINVVVLLFLFDIMFNRG